MMGILSETVLTVAQRRKRGQVLKKNKLKIQRGRERAKKRFASNDKLMVRARKAAIKAVRKKFAGKLGVDYAKLSASQKMQVDKKVETKKALLNRIAKKLFPKVRQKEMERRKNATVKKEEFMVEESPPDKKIEQWIKDNKKEFVDKYGEDKGMEILYGRAWKMYNKLNKEE